MSKSKGKIIIGPEIKSIHPWEMHSAIALRDAGFTVRFIPKHDSARSADAYLNNTLFEFKSPEGNNITNVENNLQKALRFQSKNVVIDTVRLKKIQDRSIKNYLIARMKRKRGIKKLIMVGKDGTAIDIGKLAR